MLSYSILLFLSKEGMLACSAFSVIELIQQKVGGGWDGAYLGSLFFLSLLTGFVTLVAASHDGQGGVRNAVGL